MHHIIYEKISAEICLHQVHGVRSEAGQEQEVCRQEYDEKRVSV